MLKLKCSFITNYFFKSFSIFKLFGVKFPPNSVTSPVAQQGLLNKNK